MKVYVEKTATEDFDIEKAKTDFIYFATHCLTDTRTGKPFEWSPSQIELMKRLVKRKKTGTKDF